MKVSREKIKESYMRTKSVWKTGKEVGLCGQSVHEALAKMGITMDGSGKSWTNEDDDRLRKNYIKYRNDFNIESLAKEMGRTKNFICRKAKELGFTDISRSYTYNRKTIQGSGYVHIGHHGHEHRIIMEKKLGRKLKKDEIVHHKDGNRMNNDISNLQVMTKSEHTKHHQTGEKSKNAKLTWVRVQRIREYFKIGVLRSELAIMFSVNWTTIDYIIKNKTWKI